MKRVGISKKLRFEILRRDGSACRYCGRCAPEVRIEVDHIVPVALGGTNDLLNLVAACEDCNSGKGARRLDDSTMQRQQAAALHSLEESLRDQEEILRRYQLATTNSGNQISKLLDLWWKISGEALPDEYGRVLKKWVDLYGFETVVKSMHAAAGRPVMMVGRFAAVMSMDAKEPGTKQCYLIRGILRRRFTYDDRYFRNEHGALVAGRPIDERELLAFILCCMRGGAPLDDLTYIAKHAATFGEFHIAAQDIAARAYEERNG